MRIREKKKVPDTSWKVLSERDHKKLDKVQRLFKKVNTGFFEFLEKYDPKDLNECVQKYIVRSYLDFLKYYDKKLYQKLWESEEAIIENLKDKNPFEGINPENLAVITKALERSSSFYGRGGRLTIYKIDLYTKVFKKYDAAKQNGKGPKWSGIFRNVSESKDKDGNFLISDEQDRERQMKQFLNFRNEHKLNSLVDFNKFLQIKGYPNS